MQKGEVLFTQKTSRQQAVTPMFGGRFAKEGSLLGKFEGVKAGCFEGRDCDCSRTRTTSSGVTARCQTLLARAL